ncbi:MAG: PQQ-binding-like beta-propeller repeat protein [bacterium]
MSLPRIRIFISSPGDVAQERLLAIRVIERLSLEFRHRALLDPQIYEREPLLAARGIQHQIPPASDSDIVIVILWGRMGTPLPGDLRRPDGSRYESGTQYEFEEALLAAQAKGAPAILVYRKTAAPVLDLNDETAVLEHLEQKRMLERFISRWFENPEERTAIAPFHRFTDSGQFEELLVLHLRKLLERRLLEGAAPGDAAPPETPRWTQGSPFRGLEPFEAEHAEIFCGRTRAVGDVLQALRRQAAAGHPFVLIIGASGAGKSSLVRAGILPLLTQPGVIEGIGFWRTVILRPSDAQGDLALGLATALLQPGALPELAADRTTAPELAAILRENPSTSAVLIKGALSQAASEYMRERQLERQPEARLALVIDQMEELFTLEWITTQQRLAFAHALRSLSTNGRTFVLATLRSDLYHQVQELEPLLELKAGDGSFDLLPPAPSELAQMIREPAAAAGLRFEIHPHTGAALADLLVQAAGASPGNLALLEFTLEELYDRRTPEGLLTFAAYDSIGGLDGAIAQRAEAVYSALDPTTQAAFARVFRHLVGLSAGTEEAETRRQARLAEVIATPGAQLFVDRFLAARLLVSDQGADGMPVVTLAHEALLRHWPRLRAWIEDDRELLRIKGRLQLAAVRWHEEHRAPDLLLQSGKPLEEARFFASSGGFLGVEEQEFLIASNRQAERIQRKRQAQVAALIGLSMLVAVAAVVATFSSNRALIALSQAEKSREESEAQRLSALAAQGVLLAENGKLRSSLDKLEEAYDGFTAATRPEWLHWELWDTARRGATPIATFPLPRSLSDVGYSADGRYAAVPSGETDLAMLDIQAGRIVATFPSTGRIVTSWLAPDASRVVAITDDDRLLAWNRDGSELRNTTVVDAGLPVDYVSLNVSPDARSFLVGDDHGHAYVYDLAQGKVVEEYSGYPDDMNHLSLSPDGKLIALSTGQAKVFIVDRSTKQVLHTLLGHTSASFATEFSQDSKRLVTGCYDKQARVYDIASGTLLSTLQGHGQSVDEVTFVGPTGDQVLTQGCDGMVRLWDAITGESLRVWEGDPHSYSSVAVDATGSHCILQSSGDAELQFWSLNPPGLRTAHPPTVAGDVLGVDPRGRWFYCQLGKSDPANDMDGENLAQCDLITGAILRRIPLEGHIPDDDARFSAACDLMAATEHAGTDANPKTAIALFELESGRVRWRLPVDRSIRVLGMAPNGSAVYCCERPEGRESERTTDLFCLDARDGSERWRQRVEHDTPQPHLAVAPDNHTIALGDSHGEITLSDPATGEVRHRWIVNPVRAYIQTITFSADSKELITASSDRVVNYWNVADGSNTHHFSVAGAPPGHGQVSPTGQLLIAQPAGDPGIHVWDRETGADLLSMQVGTEVSALVLQSSPELLVLSNHRNEVEAWPLGLLDTYLGLKRAVPGALASQAGGHPSPGDLETLGSWFAINGEWGWGLALMEQAQAAGAEIDPLLMARTAWLDGQTGKAVAAFEVAIKKASPQDATYLQLCRDAASAEG